MAGNRITSRPGLFGYVYHYDARGRCIGKSRPGLIGNRKIHYGADGKQVGVSRPGFLVKEVYHDQTSGRYLSSYEWFAGDVYFEDGSPVGSSHPGLFGTEYTTLIGFDDEAEEYSIEDEDLETDWLESYDDRTPTKKIALRNIFVFAAFCFLFIFLLRCFR